MIFILGAIVGGCIGFVMAAIMSNAHELDEQERRKAAKQPPVIKEEKKLTPLIAREEIPFEWIEKIDDWNDATRNVITHSLTGQLADELQKRLEVEVDSQRRMYVTKVRIWVDKK